MAEYPAATPRVYATTSTSEQEVTIRLDLVSKQAHICSCSAVWSRRITKMYGPPARVSKNRDGKIVAAYWTIAAKLISLRRPRKPGSGNPTALAQARAARNQAALPRKPLEISRIRGPILVRG